MKTGPKRKPAKDRLFAGVIKDDSGCWLWKGKWFGNKYGQIQDDDGKMVTTHRLSYRIANGEIPNGMFVCHKCDVMNCVNPDHLYVGTHEDNNRDAVDRGRRSHKTSRKILKATRNSVVRENANGRALSIDLRKKMLDEYQAGSYTQMELAKRYRVSQATVSATVRGVRNMGSGGDVHAPRSGNYRRKLSEEAKQQIRIDYAAGMIQKEIAAKHGCHQTYVSILCKEQTQ